MVQEPSPIIAVERKAHGWKPINSNYTHAIEQALWHLRHQHNTEICSLCIDWKYLELLPLIYTPCIWSSQSIRLKKVNISPRVHHIYFSPKPPIRLTYKKKCKLPESTSSSMKYDTSCHWTLSGKWISFEWHTYTIKPLEPYLICSNLHTLSIFICFAFDCPQQAGDLRRYQANGKSG